MSGSNASGLVGTRCTGVPDFQKAASGRGDDEGWVKTLEMGEIVGVERSTVGLLGGGQKQSVVNLSADTAEVGCPAKGLDGIGNREGDDSQAFGEVGFDEVESLRPGDAAAQGQSRERGIAFGQDVGTGMDRDIFRTQCRDQSSERGRVVGELIADGRDKTDVSKKTPALMKRH